MDISCTASLGSRSGPTVAAAAGAASALAFQKCSCGDLPETASAAASSAPLRDPFGSVVGGGEGSGGGGRTRGSAKTRSNPRRKLDSSDTCDDRIRDKPRARRRVSERVEVIAGFC